MTRSSEGAPDWRFLLRALAGEIDKVAGSAGRDTLLGDVGRAMAALRLLPAAGSLEALELEVNESLADICWGSARFAFDAQHRRLEITHRGLPRLGGLGEPAGTWLAPVVEGLIESWMTALPEGEGGFVLGRLDAVEPGTLRWAYAPAAVSRAAA